MSRLSADEPGTYLDADDVIDATHGDIAALAAELRDRHADDTAYARAAFDWVRDEVAHSYDAQHTRVTVAASQVLAERTGLCFAKSHLLAALLRAQGVPAGLCYQKIGDDDGDYLHGLVAVFLDGAWHRQDPRGNRPGFEARFSLGDEQLVYPPDSPNLKLDYETVWRSPAPNVLAALRGADDALALCARGLPTDLPD